TDASGASYDTTTNKEGIYEFKDLAPGAYALKAVAKGFDPFTQENMQITANQVQQVNVSLTVHVEPEKVEVTGKAANQATQAVPAKGPTGGLTGMVTDPSGAGVPKASVRLTDARGASYDATSNKEGIYEFKALPPGVYALNGGQIYIDGFTGGQLPPKASIREIRINQNPFSSEYDKLGYGRIEVLTKPGTDQLHGQFWVMGNMSAFNSKNPFEGAGPPPDYYSTQYEGHLGGALGKKVSFFTNVERRNLNELSVVDTPYV